MNIEFYDMRIAAIDEAAKRSRWVFVAISIAAVAIIGATWNHLPLGIYGPASDLWDRGFATNAPTAVLQKSLLKGWVDSLFVSVPLLGLKFSIADAALLGSFTLLILAIWKFYVLRRENHLIGGLLHDARHETSRIRSYVFHGICGTQVFATLTNNDNPILSFDTQEGRTFRGIRGGYLVLSYLPAIAILFVIITDLCDVFWFKAIFRQEHIPIIDVVKEASRQAGNSQKLANFLIMVGVYQVIALCLVFVSGFVLWKAGRFQHGTMALLRLVNREGWGAVEAGPDPQ
jgi:hypothetical protein